MNKYFKDYAKLLALATGYWGLLSIAAVFMGISTIFEGVTFTSLGPVVDRIFVGKKIIIPGQVPDFVRDLIDRLNTVQPADFLRVVVFVIPVLFLLKGIVQIVHEYLMTVVAEGVVRDVRNRLYAKFQDLSMNFYASRRTGELMSRVTNDAAIITNAISYALKDLIFESMKIGFFGVGTFILGFKISWKLLFIVFIIFPAIMYPVIKIGKRIKKLTIAVQEKIADLNSQMAETIQGAMIVKAFCR